MLDRLDYLQNLLPGGKGNRVVPMYMFTNDCGLPVVLRVNMGHADPALPVMLVAFDIDTLATSVRCEIQFPTENMIFHLFGRLTAENFLIGTRKIEGWQTLEKLALQWMKTPLSTA